VPNVIKDEKVISSEVSQPLEQLKENLQFALAQLKTAVNQSFLISNQDNELKRLAAKEWELTANSLIDYIKETGKRDSQNLLSWFSLINLRF